MTRVRRLASRERLQVMIRQEVYETVDQLEQSWRRVLAAKQGVEVAHRNYRVEQSQFELGQRTSTEVLYAAESLADSQMSEIHAFADYEIAKVLLARATGTLLGYGQIQLGPIDAESEHVASIRP